MKYTDIFHYTMLLKRFGLVSLLALNTAQAEVDIEYKIEACCSLCPEANKIENYNTSLLRQQAQLIEGENGWLYRSNLDLDEDFELDDLTINDLKRFRKALAAKGTKLMMVYQPTRGLINPAGILDNRETGYNFNLASSSYKEALKQIRSAGILVPNLSDLIDEGDTPKFYFRRDTHWTPYGAMLTAKLVADAIKALDLYPLLPKKSYTTHRTGMLNVSGSHQNAAYQICGTKYPSQYVNEFETEQAEASDADLFGDGSLPEIVVSGTSFTNSQINYNFVGYMKEFLSVDILNVGQAGGGLEGALIQYLPSEDFQENPPRLLIWEVPSYTKLSKHMIYRQLEPLVNNGCTNKPATLSHHLKLKRGTNELLFNGGGEVKHLLSGDYLLDIQFNTPDIKRLSATVWYHNSRKENITLKHRDRVNAQGRFVFELRSEGEWKDFIFTSLDLEIDDSYPENLEVTATMCQRTDIKL